jgi:NRPS condensation-like uncharacterized protein
MADRFEPAGTQNFTTITTLRGVLSEERLARALCCLEKRHPLLRARIDRSEPEQKFVAGEAREIPLFVVQASEAELPALIARSIEPCAWNELGYHAQLSWVQHAPEHSSLLLRQHHLVSDGGSGILAMRDLLNFLDDPDLERVEPLPSLGQDAYFPASFAQLREKVLEQIRAGKPPAPKPLRLSRWEDASPTSRRAYVRPLRLSEQASDALAHRARKDGATVHGALMAAFALAIAQETGESGLQRLTHPVDLRRYLREYEPSCAAIPEVMGYYVSSVTTDHEVHGSSELGALAREVTEAVRTAKADREPLWSAPIRGPLLIERTRDLDVNAFRDVCEQRVFANTFAVSNLGPLERMGVASTVDKLQVEDFYFAGASSLMNQLGGSVVSFAGRLSLQLNCVEPLVPRELLDALAARMEGLLRAYANITAGA